MSASYTFLPWARQGLGNQITQVGALRGSFPVELAIDARRLDGTTSTVAVPPRTVELFGPGDVVGVQARAVVRTEPRDWITNFEPNYLAAIEFYDEDFPWRYTPATPDAAGKRLTPWITLAVLKEKLEFEEGVGARARKLPFVTLKSGVRQTAFPDADTLWAWAHVHVNGGLTSSDAEIVASDRQAVAERLESVLGANPDLAFSRLVCPRRLEPNASYCALLIPTFESGRLAGLGLDPALSPSATASAWAGTGPEPDAFPVYFRWQFRTGTVGDFEYLVRLLEHKPVDKRVGVRDLDVQGPGMVPGISDPSQHGTLPLGGALRVPRANFDEAELAEVERRERWDRPRPHPFQQDLAALINLADAYTSSEAAQANAAAALPGVTGNPDPVIAPPLYGRWHAKTARLLTRPDGTPAPNADNWVHELNLDPIFRVPAGFGTKVIQSKQDELMAAAWEQVGDVLEANQRIRRLKLAQHVSFVWHASELGALAARNPTRLLSLTSPVHARVLMGSGTDATTVRARVAAAAISPALVAPTLRRIVRPRARLARSLAADGHVHDTLLLRVNDGQLSMAPPKGRPAGVVSVNDLATGALPSGVPAWLVEWLRESPGIVRLPLIVAAVLALFLAFVAGTPAGAVVAFVAGVVASVALLAARRAVNGADSLLEEAQTPESIDRLATSPDFVFSEASPSAALTTLSRSGSDSVEAARFKTALKELNEVLGASIEADSVGENGPARAPLDFAGDVRGILRGIDPAVTMPRRAAAVAKLPRRIREEMRDDFAEVMAHPVFDIPMYEPLAALSAELLIPNVDLIENNSITLLETNRRFVEAYMAGVNHEFARELLWREYPTDQRGSFFRQFWDASSFLANANASGDDAREGLRDIQPIHEWPLDSKLGEHDARKRPSGSPEDLVLVIRGELLKRYPGAVIFAQAAAWAETNGVIDPSKERTLVALDPSEEANPPRSKLRTPLYMGKVEPDIYFLGFDLTVAEARGGDGTPGNASPGWFFVIKERPGEPRFGFDVTSTAPFVVWNDLGWDQVPMAGQHVSPLPGIAPGTRIPGASPSGEEEKETQRTEDVHVEWNDQVSAAELAYIMYQAPVMVAIHAAEMLPRS